MFEMYMEIPTIWIYTVCMHGLDQHYMRKQHQCLCVKMVDSIKRHSSMAIGPPTTCFNYMFRGIICSEAGVSLVTNQLIVTNFMNFKH